MTLYNTLMSNAELNAIPITINHKTRPLQRPSEGQYLERRNPERIPAGSFDKKMGIEALAEKVPTKENRMRMKMWVDKESVSKVEMTGSTFPPLRSNTGAVTHHSRTPESFTQR